ncbi:MAG: hypothetical protein A2X23_05070 [Chloroflexi bacterium GWC2_73_18]|nr:MAG: hypothetical protein A2X23_05070 [Chloroflexi bacterium GWC2_73_18]
MRRIAMRGRRSILGRTYRAGRGQSLAEFALILTPLLLLLLGIIQFGFIFNTSVTITNAVREGAREGTIYVYDQTRTKAQNDAARNDRIRTTVLASLNNLTKTAPQFDPGSAWSQSVLVFSSGDLQVTYAVPSGVTDSDPRTGEQITVQLTYHQDLLIPFIASLLPKDANGRIGLSAQATMVIN